MTYQHVNKGDAMKMITDEKLGQYSTRRHALRAARTETRRTGARHRIIMTTCYRDLAPMICWAVYLDRGAQDARVRAYGA